MNNFIKLISISIIINATIMFIIVYCLPSLFFADPSEKWWVALSIIVTLSFGVIAISVTVLLRENESKRNITSLEKNLEKYKTESTKSYENALSFISNVLDIQNLSETSSDENWERILNNINAIKDFGISKSMPLRIWSTAAWKQGYLDIALCLREKAYQLDSNDLRNRIMLCSILTQAPKPDSARIENILNNTDLKSDNITDGDIDHFYNVKGTFYKKIGRFEEASEFFKKALKVNIQTWSFNDYIITLIMRKDIDDYFIKCEIDRIKEIPNSKWLDDTVLYQKAFRLFVNGFINKSEIEKFYNYLTPPVVLKLITTYNNEYIKMMFFHFYSQITRKYNDRNLNMLYLSFYKLLGVYDEQADNELQKQEILDEINKKIILTL